MILKKIIRRKVDDNLPELSNFPPKIQQILQARGIHSENELDYSLANILPLDGLLNVQKAAQYLFKAIKQDKFILVIGDFDADGATSSAVVLKALAALGAKHVDFLVPDRFKFGYGLSVKLVEHAQSLSPDLIVTVDNGIANIEGVARANELNIPVIVTDHHLASEQLPEALAIVNPNQPNDTFSSKNLAGVGVAFYLMLALRSEMRNVDWFSQQNIDEPNLAELLDIVALGTVADVVPLDRNNRILVEQGLKRIRSGRACPGIKAILQVANRDFSQCQATDLGFSVGPRLNAAGRLDDMSIGIHCLLAQSLEQAMPIAQRLDALNKSRKSIEGEMLEQAEVDLEKYLQHHSKDFIQEERPSAMCLFDPSWHQGVIGILASRVKDKINRPVIVFAQDDDSDEPSIKGSARSVKGVHIRDVLAFIDSQNPYLIEKFGGHAMAAGLTVKRDNFQLFAEKFHDAVLTNLKGEKIRDEIVTDSGLTEKELAINFAYALRNAGPWGQGFPEPLFDDTFEVVAHRIVGENHLKLVLRKQFETEVIEVDAIYFRCPQQVQVNSGDQVHLVYKIDINEFRGNVSLQLLIEQLEIL